MEKKQSEFNKVFSAWDILVIAFGAMIGWGWVVSSGGWIQKGGVLGAALGFVVGGVMIFFVGLTYAELTAAMPQCGGEHVWSHRAMGPTGSFVCTWAIILGYVGVACFEACAFPTIISYLWPGFLKGYLYTVAGFDIYASWLIVAILVAFGIMLINIVGAKTAAKLQTILTIIIGGAGILLIVASVINGTVDNLDGQMFAEVGAAVSSSPSSRSRSSLRSTLSALTLSRRRRRRSTFRRKRSAACSSCRSFSRSCSTHSSSLRSVWS